MITPRGIQPDKSLYAIGAVAIDVLNKQSAKECDLDELYSEFQKRYSKRVTFSYFVYALDWLYLVGLVDVGGKQNKIKKCF